MCMFNVAVFLFLPLKTITKSMRSLIIGGTLREKRQYLVTDAGNPGFSLGKLNGHGLLLSACNAPAMCVTSLRWQAGWVQSSLSRNSSIRHGNAGCAQA